ncbi:MAG: IPT/TIG domain-containing protein [Clostridia bacterium]|nr:IPT/TIG domain-containing protein [Clostridia bacterium]
MKKRIIALTLVFVLMFSNLSYFVDASVNISDVRIDSITFRKVHTGYEIAGAYIEIWGANLNDATILFEHVIDGFRADMGDLEINTSGLLRYTFTKEEAINFGSRIAVDGTQINLNLASFPNFSDADKNVYNVDLGETIALTGANLNTIDNNIIKASYGNLEREFIVYDPLNDTPNLIKIENPAVPGGILGEQTLSIESNTTEAVGAEDYEKRVVYVYYNAFRLIENLDVTDPNLYPNTGAKGDEFFIEADDLNPNRDYQVYFVTDTGQELNANNKADFVSLSIDYEGAKDRLTFKVPDRADFDELEYTLILTDTQNNSVIAQQILPDTFSVVDATFLPTIEEIYPTSGPQEGADIQVDGRNLVSLNIPDLATSGVVTGMTQDGDGLHISYQNSTYNGLPVTITKDMVVKVGGKATFLLDEFGVIRYNQGTIDSIFIHAPQADDAETDPYKDVNIEMKITITGAGFEYVFNQVVVKRDGFMFIPSSITPIVDKIVPATNHVVGTPGDYYTGEDMMLVIEGGNFMVNRYTDGSGNVYVNYPQVLIKTLNDQSLANYDIFINPNAEIAGVKGIIYDMSDTILSGNNYVKNGDGTPYQLDFKVVDDNGQIITGTQNNDIGTRIIARIPRNVKIDVADFKNVLVVNPTRNSSDPGKKLMTVEGIAFVDTNDIPIIESVTPNVVTVEGNEEVVIIGNNFQEGAKIYLNGDEILGFTRDISQSGDKIILTFTAPPGPASRSQVVVQNPSGAIATQDFYYVTSFNKDPIITDFVPLKGTADTYVVINGENFLKEDPTAETLTGLDALRVIGTRVLLDNEDVNDYNLNVENNIIFETYTEPDVISFMTRDDGNKRINLTPFDENLYIKDDSGVYYYLSNDGDGNPVITDNLNNDYVFKYEVDRINIYKDDVLLDRLEGNYTFVPDVSGTKGTATITIDGKIITIEMDNNVLFIGEAAGGVKVPRLSDYGDSLILISDNVPSEYYKLYEDFDNTIVLTNGKDQLFEVKVEGGQLVARKNVSEAYEITMVSDTGFTVEATPNFTLTMATAYKKDSNDQIVGHKAKVLNRNQIAFTVPVLDSGKGYKDLKVVNPDTKYDEKIDEAGFYYIEQASSNPKITNITPPEGSVDGGYAVKIEGKGFEEDMSVYIDGMRVPDEDVVVATDGNSVNIIMPKLLKDLAEDYGVSFLEVPVVVLNHDGGTDSRIKGFKYIIPTSSPEIDYILPTGGTTNGGTIVEIIGYEFRFFEPYKNLVGGQNYDIGDEFVDLYKDGLWTNLLDANVPAGAVTEVPIVPEHPYYSNYYVSPILPRVYFGDQVAKIVEYDSGYLKVLSPQNIPGEVDVYVVNNDSGVSNKVKYTYSSSKPTITKINPSFGKRQGLELRDVYGLNMYQGSFTGYKDDDDTVITALDHLEASIRFSDITNKDIARGELNSGLINAERATVQLEGDLRVEYNGSSNTITMSVVEDGKIYNRVFNNYDDSTIYLPMEMLKTADGEYYHPADTDASLHDGGTYENLVFEYIRVSVEDKRFLVERSYAPRVDYDNSSHLIVTTPSYYSVGDVPVLLTNPDYGEATSTFKYTNPDSEPKIYQVSPRELSPDGTKYYTKRSVKGGTQIEITGLDFRDNLSVYIGSTKVTVAEKTVVVKVVDGVQQTFDLLIVNVPAGLTNEVGIEQAVIITNTDYGVANSSNVPDIFGSDKKPMFFVYQLPLSDPKITEIRPSETSQYGGHLVTLVGSDFRTGATVTIGSSGGVPITNTTILERGTILTFTTPLNTLLPGDKAIQVQNDDYGTSGSDKTIKIISYPTVDNTITFEDGNTVNWVSVEGGTKIVITGKNFYEGAKVYFGGTRQLSDDSINGVKGLFRDDKYYVLSNAYAATEVEVVSENEIIVTTPQIPIEETYKITVLNSDGGLSDENASVLYSVPVPSKPVGLKLELIDNRYIRISDYTASGHKYYEIYYFVGSKTPTLIKDNHYLDMRYLGSTDIEPYRLPSINAVETMRSNELLIIGLKAVNEFGSSDWSNLEYLTYDQLKNVEELGDPNIDGSIGVPEGYDYISEVIGTELVTTLSAKTLAPSVYINLSTANYNNIFKRVVNVPGAKILSSTSIVRIDYSDVNIQFTPLNLNTTEFRALNTTNVYGRIATSTIEDAYSGYMLGQVPRGYKVLSKVVTIGYDAKNNTTQKIISALNGAMDIVMKYDPLILSGYPESSVEMYRFNVTTNTWTKLSYTIDQVNNRVSVRTNMPGAYVLMLKR